MGAHPALSFNMEKGWNASLLIPLSTQELLTNVCNGAKWYEMT